MEESIRGKWVNTITGETVIASSIINDGDQGMVMTNNGIIPMSEFTNYIQIGEEDINSTTAGITTNANIKINDSIMSSSDRSLLNEIVKPSPHKEQQIPKSTPAKPKKESENYGMIDKLFSKFGGVKLKIEIDWADFPKEQLKTLIDIYDVPKIEIANYISKNFASLDNVAKEIENGIL